MAHSAVVLPVPEVEPLVARRGVPAHLVLLRPFAPLAAIDEGLVAELRAFFADVLPFEYTLSGMARPAEEMAYLVPEPVRPFRHLAQELYHRFPEYPPFGGAFDIVVPHLAIPMEPGEDAEQLLGTLELPIEAHAVEANLLWVVEEDDEDVGVTRLLETFAFGTAAA